MTKQCEGLTADFTQDVLTHALEDGNLVTMLQQIAHPDARPEASSALLQVRLIRRYLLEAMHAKYAEIEEPISPDLYDTLAARRSESVDDEIDRRKDDRLTGHH